MAEEIARLEAIIADATRQINEIRSREERTAKINQITEMLASASIQQVDHVLNYLRGVENVQNAVAPTVAIPADAVAQAIASQEDIGMVIAEPIAVEPTLTVSTEPITEPTVETSEPVTYIEQANVEDYLVDGRIPWTDATISIVGLSHQHMWSIDHHSPQIGDIVRLAPTQRTRNDGSPVHQILAYTTEETPRAIGTLPQRPPKTDELENMGAPIVKNQDAWDDESMRNGKMATVVGVIPGRFCFLKLNEEDTPTPTEEPAPVEEPEVPEVPEGVERILEGFAADAAEARRMFEAQKASHHLYSRIDEIGRWFKVEYFDNRCNSNDFIKYVAVAKAE